MFFIFIVWLLDVNANAMQRKKKWKNVAIVISIKYTTTQIEITTPGST